MKRVFLLLGALSLISPSAVVAQGASPAPVVLSADTKETFSGVAFIAPKDWSMQQTDTITILSAPENDTRLFIIHIGAATDGKAAVASAWKLVEPIVRSENLGRRVGGTYQRVGRARLARLRDGTRRTSRYCSWCVP